jgi:hypothetical protein
MWCTMKTIRCEDLPEELSARAFLNSLDVSDEVLLESHGQLRAVLISPKSFEERRSARAQLFELIDSIRAANPGTDADVLLSELANDDAAAV